MEVTITEDDFEIPEVCPVFGFELRFGGGLSDKWCSPSLDRIDNTKGYVPGNVVVVSTMANICKGPATPEQLRSLADFYTKIQENDPQD